MLKTLKELNVRVGDKVRHHLPGSRPGDVYTVAHVDNCGQVYAGPALFRLNMTSPYWEIVERHRDRSIEGVNRFINAVSDLAAQHGYKGVTHLEALDKNGLRVEFSNGVVKVEFRA